jgi:hypothetical protein
MLTSLAWRYLARQVCQATSETDPLATCRIDPLGYVGSGLLASAPALNSPERSFSRRRSLSPRIVMPCHQQNQQSGQESPLSETLFVALPGHPLYGRSVHIVRRRSTSTATHCLIQDPDRPKFRYQILERWLSASAPPPPASPAVSPLVLSLVALDRLLQRLLGMRLTRRAKDDEQRDKQGIDPDLGSASPDQQSTAR